MVALFVAMGGTGYAALRLPKNSVGAAQIKTGAVGTSEVKDHSLRLRDFRSGQIPAGPRGAIGPAGPAGANGQGGAPGQRGPSDGYVATSSGVQDNSDSVSVTVPAGDYMAAGDGQVLYFRSDSAYPTVEGEVRCVLAYPSDATHTVGTFATVPSQGYSIATDRGGVATVSQHTAFHVPAGGTITYTCDNAPDGTRDPSATMEYSNLHLTAIQVGTLHAP
jgi:hypothetical protein